VEQANIVNKDQLDLVFENGDILSIYDNPEFRSCWFLDGREIESTTPRLQTGDLEPDDMTEEEIQARRAQERTALSLI
jgi:hypothetical protein